MKQLEEAVRKSKIKNVGNVLLENQKQESEKKTDWVKVIKLIIKILEPELKKTPAYYRIIPLILVVFEVVGIFESVKFLLTIKLF